MNKQNVYSDLRREMLTAPLSIDKVKKVFGHREDFSQILTSFLNDEYSDYHLFPGNRFIIG